MSCIFVVAVVSNICSITASEVSSQEKEALYPLLAELSLPKDALPPGCSIPEDVKPPIKGLKNCHITTDSHAFILMGGDDAVTKELQRKVKAIYYAVYEEGNELGIFAWAFDRPESAKKAHRLLTDRHKDRFRLWRKGECVICLWRDKGTSDNCFQHFGTFIQKKVDGFGRTGS